ncbi:TRAP transporter small permease [Arsenicitalea aurantiaca]|uniref:TRAP transporter small permease protein n=1 Tax=Arsenicitalea aurantiaca TaxID=1783274 RepID=A0A433XLA9_9HYPH|nr:TRAP transporter small permease [Arsenicitalea aurantiaca]RUT34778.1 TRAP transporter small permease [Arsenicitalea aurantiaca]
MTDVVPQTLVPPPTQGWSRALERAEFWIDRLVSVLTVGTLVFMVGLVFYAVVMRYVFSAPLVYSYDLSTMLFAWIVFVGLFVAERDGAHIGLDILYLIKSEGLRRAVIALRQVFMIALAAYMTYISTVLILRTGMQISSMRISARWLYASLPVGFALLTLIYLLRLPRLALAKQG